MPIPPVIIIGMHRSGTTMITKMLENLGLFVGDKKEINNEALFFWDINNWIFEIACSRADLPHNFQYLNPRTRQILIDDLNYFVQSSQKKKFLGDKNNAYKSLKDLDIPWGWKDPKNSFTIDLWKEIFPNAVVLHIYRNPIDSISSFIERDLKMKDKYQLNWKKALKRKLLISKNYHSNFRLYSLEEGYNLWEEYVTKCMQQEQFFPNMKHVRYEDFLAEPSLHLHSIATFCGLNFTEQQINEQVKSVKSDRSFAFTKNPEAIDVYLKVKDKPLMKQLNYDNII
ncbi:MAG: sulfotransferase [Chitinophagales bacterium]|nr:sulfotransferase [Chitinophagales bacterium]